MQQKRSGWPHPPPLNRHVRRKGTTYTPVVSPAAGTPERWLQYIAEVFPDRYNRTYFLPSVYFQPVPYTSSSFEGQTVSVLQSPTDGASAGGGRGPKKRSKKGQTVPAASGDDHVESSRPQVAGALYTNPSRLPQQHVQKSDARDKETLQRVLHHLDKLFQQEKECAMVISDLRFLDYLGAPCSDEDVQICAALPKITGLQSDFQRGDFDLLIIHRQGILIGELKSIKPAEDQDPEEFQKAVVKRVQKAVNQLNKAGKVLKGFISDCGNIAVQRTLILPNLTAPQLGDILGKNADLSNALKSCLQANNLSTAMNFCLFSLSGIGAKPSQMVAYLRGWWRRVAKQISHPVIEDAEYDKLLTRFCGPATSVKVPTIATPHKAIKTTGQGVAETGLHFSILALYPTQLMILNKDCKRLFLTGPPGTGKSLVLALKVTQWLRQGKRVHIVSIQYKGRAVSILLEHQILESVKATADPSVVSVKTTADPPVISVKTTADPPVISVKATADLPGISVKTVSDPSLIAAADPSKVREEITVDPSMVMRHDFNFDTEHLDVDKAVRDLSSFAINGELFVIIDEVGNRYRDRFKEFCTKLIEQVPSVYLWAANLHKENIPQCLETVEMTTMLRCPPVIHREVQQSALVGVDSARYSQTPQPVATEGPEIIWLHHRGLKGHTEREAKNCPECGCQIAYQLEELGVDQSGSEGLQYRDVLIIYYNPDHEQVMTSAASPMTSEPPSIMEGLAEHGVPVTLLKRHDTVEAYKDVALALSNTVTVSHWENVAGLERRIVVGMGDVTDIDRFYAMTRCTAQLIWIEPGEPDPGKSS